MSALTETYDHILRGLGYTIGQYRGRPLFNILCACYLNQVQHLENAIHGAVDAWALDTAVGWRLDVLGALVGQPRIGATDDIYRLYIKARIQVNRSTGRYETLNWVATVLIPDFRYFELSQNCFFELVDPDYSYAELSAVWNLLQAAAPAGVRVHLGWEEEDAFEFQVTGQIEVDASYGFSDVAETTVAGNLGSAPGQ